MSAADVASKLRVDVERVQDWTSGAQQPNKTNFNKIQSLLDRPESFFFLPAPPASARSTARFRSHAGKAGRPEPDDLKAIKVAQNLQIVVRWLSERMVLAPTIPRAGLGDQPEIVAKSLRVWLGWTEADQLARLDNKDYHVARALRENIEDRGVSVLNLTLSVRFRGFSLPDAVAPVVAISTRDDTRARIFSYVHELAHMALGDESICNVEPENKTERWCDAVAGAFLMPKQLLLRMLSRSHVKAKHGPDGLDEVKRVANRLNVSYRAMARRLERLGLGEDGLYKLVHRVTSTASRGGGGRGPAQTRARRRLQRYGLGYVGRLVEAERQGELDRADLLDLLDLSRSELKELDALLAEGADG
jgi:Zn-dependent peptidase ImmA (M78 family)